MLHLSSNLMALICFDVDGTLFDNDTKSIHPDTVQALWKLKENHKIALSTGRSLESVKGAGLIDNIDWDGFILHNGQLVLDTHQNVITADYLDHDAFEKLYEYCNEEGLNLSIANKNDWYLTKEKDINTVQAHEYFDEVIPHVGKYQHEDVVMAIIYAPLGWDTSKIEALHSFQITPSLTTSIDICKAGCHKSKGIHELMNALHEKEIIAFGDGHNDVEMLKDATIGIAMGQAVEECKEVADYVTKSCQEQGVAFAIDKLHLYEKDCIQKFYK